MKNDSGFNLVELLVTCAIFSVIMAGIFAVLYVGDASWQSDMGLLDLQQSARRAMYDIVKEARQSAASSVTISGGNTRIEFTIPSTSDTINYYLDDNQVIRDDGSTTSVVANFIDSLTFSLSGNLLRIDIEAAKTAKGRSLSFPLMERVRLRNG